MRQCACRVEAESHAAAGMAPCRLRQLVLAYAGACAMSWRNEGCFGIRPAAPKGRHQRFVSQLIRETTGYQDEIGESEEG